jgi:hypothetical protein
MYLWLWLLPIAIVISGLIHLAIASRPFPKGRIFEIALLHILLWGTGIGSLIGFYATTFEPLASRLAADLGWSSHNPFQQLEGIALLSLGVLGVACVWLRGGFWAATILLAFVMGWTELGTLLFNGASPFQILVSGFYDGFGTLLLLILLILFRLRAGYDRFWDLPMRA